MSTSNWMPVDSSSIWRPPYSSTQAARADDRASRHRPGRRSPAAARRRPGRGRPARPAVPAGRPRAARPLRPRERLQPGAELLGLRLDLAAAEAVDPLARGTALQPDRHRAVGDGVGQLADAGDRLRAEGREVLVADVGALADTDGGFAARRWPVFNTPRSASAYSLSPPNAASDSSSSSVGASASILRGSTAAVVRPVNQAARRAARAPPAAASSPTASPPT